MPTPSHASTWQFGDLPKAEFSIKKRVDQHVVSCSLATDALSPSAGGGKAVLYSFCYQIALELKNSGDNDEDDIPKARVEIKLLS